MTVIAKGANNVRLTDRRLEGLVVVVADKTAWSVDPSALLRPGPSGAVVVGVAAPSSPSTRAAVGDAAELGDTVDVRRLLAAVDGSSSSSSPSLLDSSEERRSSTLFDEDVRSDSVPRFLLLLAMSNCSRIPRDVALRVVS